MVLHKCSISNIAGKHHKNLSIIDTIDHTVLFLVHIPTCISIDLAGKQNDDISTKFMGGRFCVKK